MHIVSTIEEKDTRMRIILNSPLLEKGLGKIIPFLQNAVIVPLDPYWMGYTEADGSPLALECCESQEHQ
jgi:hypothetical protein